MNPGPPFRLDCLGLPPCVLTPHSLPSRLCQSPGVPFTIKESFRAKGLPQTVGHTEWANVISEEDGWAVSKLRAAGAILVGKTNVPIDLSDWQSFNAVYGRTNNPWNLGLSPGGSSGGSSASLAAGFVPLEVGTDIGGSIRVPSMFCGTFGHKPTHGIIPLDARPTALPGSVRPLSVAGPMARCCKDLAAAMDVLADVLLPRPRFDSLKGVRIFVSTTHPKSKVSKSIVDAIEAAAARAETAGATLTRESPLFPDPLSYYDDYSSLLLMAMTRGTLPKNPDGSLPTAGQYIDLLDRQARVIKQWSEFFNHFDAILMPVFASPAFPHTDEADQLKRHLVVDGTKEPFIEGGFAFASLATYGGLPATAVPLGLADGLPIGMQVVTDRLRDHDAIALGKMLAVPV